MKSCSLHTRRFDFSENLRDSLQVFLVDPPIIGVRSQPILVLVFEIVILLACQLSAHDVKGFIVRFIVESNVAATRIIGVCVVLRIDGKKFRGNGTESIVDYRFDISSGSRWEIVQEGDIKL